MRVIIYFINVILFNYFPFLTKAPTTVYFTYSLLPCRVLSQTSQLHGRMDQTVAPFRELSCNHRFVRLWSGHILLVEFSCLLTVEVWKVYTKSSSLITGNKTHQIELQFYMVSCEDFTGILSYRNGLRTATTYLRCCSSNSFQQSEGPAAYLSFNKKLTKM